MIAPAPVVPPILIAERRVVRHLREAGALSAATATAFTPERRLHRKALAKLQGKGAAKAGPAGTLWLDEPAYAAMRGKRRKLAGAILGATVAALAAVFLNR